MAADATPLSPDETRRWTRIGALSAFALLLGYVESFVPLPLPGVKLGLANMAVLVVLASGDVSGAFFVAMVKVAAAGLLFGNPITLAYSLVGTLLSLCLMAPLSKLPTMRLEMVSIVGALAHQTGQLLVAQVLLGTPLVWYGAPVMGLAGCVTGLLCGMAATRMVALVGQDQDAGGAQGQAPAEQPQTVWTDMAPETAGNGHGGPSTKTCLALVAYLALVVLALHTRRLGELALCMALSLAWALARHVSPRALQAALVPIAPIALVTLVAQIASNQQGVVAFALGGLCVTRAALTASAAMLLRLLAIATASVALSHAIERDELIACANAAMAPLRALGLRTAGPELAFSTALQLIPLLAARIEQACATGRHPLSREFWARELPRLAATIYQEALR